MALDIEQIKTSMMEAATEAKAAHDVLHQIKAELDGVQSLDQLQAVKDDLDASIANLKTEVDADSPVPVPDVPPTEPAPEVVG